MTSDRSDARPTEDRKERAGTGVALSRPVQEHLARQLRAAYYERQDRPAFLGDPALPVEFDEHLYRLWSSETAHRRRRANECGIAAVRAALEGADA
jgi:hypothetical protein